MVGEEIAVVPNGVDLEDLAPAPAGNRYPEPTLLYLGRLKKYKRVDLIFRAVAMLRDRGSPVRLLVAGRGDQEASLKKLRNSLALGEAVEFLGYVPEEGKVELLQRSWIHVLTSPKEGWGISILEAAACGTPTVASDSPGLRDAVQNGETGSLVPHGDIRALATALGRLLGNREVREAMGRRARAFSEGFTWKASARKMEAFLERRVAATRSQG
jgi:glycosyltransferase involved in cell wall biosynthesis